MRTVPGILPTRFFVWQIGISDELRESRMECFRENGEGEGTFDIM